MLTIVTINFNGTEDTIRLLDSLRQQTDTDFEIIVVDNDSTESARQRLGEYVSVYPYAIDVIYSPSNLGFSGGNNLGIRKAIAQGAEWLMLLNNDATVEPHFIGDTKAQLSGKPRLISLPIREGSRTAYAGKIRWLTTTLPHVYHQVPESHDTYAIGASLLVHRDVFERIGFLDESYFLYFEDADFSVRARRAGIKIEHASHPYITHAVSSSTKKLGSPLLLRYHLRNAIQFNRRYAPWWARFILPFILVWEATKQVGKILFGRHQEQSRALLAGLTDALLGNMGNISNRPTIAIECESLEDVSWGTARLIRGFMNAFVTLPEVRDTYDIIAYFKSRVPDEPWLKNSNVHAVIVRPFSWMPPSFSAWGRRPPLRTRISK